MARGSPVLIFPVDNGKGGMSLISTGTVVRGQGRKRERGREVEEKRRENKERMKMLNL